MQVKNIPLTETGQMHPLTQDYLLGVANTKPLYDWPLSLDGLKQALEERKKYPVDRATLVNALTSQYEALDAHFLDHPENQPLKQNLTLLQQENTFTITTGHQLNIFTGPLFFIYKLISAIKYARQLKEKFPAYNFIPVYWMASEDHDFAEINHLHLWGRTLQWETENGGAVGQLDPKSLAPLLEEMKPLMGDKGQDLYALFEQAYLQHGTLAQATRYLVHRLLGHTGLVILDADQAELKQQFIPILQQDIIRQVFEKRIQHTLSGLQHYKLPVNPRAINVFYLSEQGRHRMVDEGGYFQVKEIGKKWTVDELISELNSQPQNFSPNVVLRPMYQESILPNLAYIGGNNEIAYWMELKSAFETAHLFFPQLVVRDSALWLGKRAAKDLNAFSLSVEDMFTDLKTLKNKFYDIQSLSHPAEETLEKILCDYDKLKDELQSLPSGFVAGMVKGMNAQLKELKKWKNEVHAQQLQQEEKNIEKLEKLYSLIFPESSFQERYENFIPYYMRYGQSYFDMLLEAFNPLAAQLHVFIEED